MSIMQQPTLFDLEILKQLDIEEKNAKKICPTTTESPKKQEKNRPLSFKK